MIPPGDDSGCPAQAPTESISSSSTTPTFYDLAAVCEAFAVLTVTVNEDGEPKFLRRIYLSLHSAEKAVRRAEHRGKKVVMVLCKLTPVQADLLASGWSS